MIADVMIADVMIASCLIRYAHADVFLSLPLWARKIAELGNHTMAPNHGLDGVSDYPTFDCLPHQPRWRERLPNPLCTHDVRLFLLTTASVPFPTGELLPDPLNMR